MSGASVAGAGPGWHLLSATSLRWTIVGLVGAAILATAVTGFEIAYADRIVAGVRVIGLDLGGQSVAGARGMLESAAGRLSQEQVTLRADGKEWQLPAQETGMHVDADAMAQQAFAIGRAGNPLQRGLTQLRALLFGFSVASPLLRFDIDREYAVLDAVAAQVDRPPQDAQVEVSPRADGTVSLVIVPELPGARLDRTDSAERVRVAISRGLPARVELAVSVEEAPITRAKLEPARAQAERMVERPVTLTHRGGQWNLRPKQVAAALTFPLLPNGQFAPRIAPDALESALAPVREEVDQPADDARFAWDGKTTRVIRDGQDGFGIDSTALAIQLEQGLISGTRTFALPLGPLAPTIGSQDGSKLGIKDLIREGRTAFPGAVPAKQHNIQLAASRLNGTVVRPGGLFSFNQEVGPTTLDAGFQTGWGITLSGSEARTIPSVAGGICQVATTLFHPVFHAGYAIEERHPHLYWIQSYGQAPLGMKGLDATVDAEFGLDFQFVNNTPNYLLIQSRVEASTLIFDLYGTKPDWDVQIEVPSIRNVAPADRAIVRQAEPTMPAGNQLQVEAAQDGFDVSILRTVTSNEGPRRLDLRSHYIPSRNVVLYGGPPEPEAEGAAEGADHEPAAGQAGPGPGAFQVPATPSPAAQPAIAVPTTTPAQPVAVASTKTSGQPATGSGTVSPASSGPTATPARPAPTGVSR